MCRRRRASCRSVQAFRFAASASASAWLRGRGSGSRSKDVPLEALLAEGARMAPAGGGSPDGPAPEVSCGGASAEGAAVGTDVGADSDVGVEWQLWVPAP